MLQQSTVYVWWPGKTLVYSSMYSFKSSFPELKYASFFLILHLSTTTYSIIKWCIKLFKDSIAQEHHRHFDNLCLIGQMSGPTLRFILKI